MIRTSQSSSNPTLRSTSSKTLAKLFIKHLQQHGINVDDNIKHDGGYTIKSMKKLLKKVPALRIPYEMCNQLGDVDDFQTEDVYTYRQYMTQAAKFFTLDQGPDGDGYTDRVIRLMFTILLMNDYKKETDYISKTILQIRDVDIASIYTNQFEKSVHTFNNEIDIYINELTQALEQALADNEKIRPYRLAKGHTKLDAQPPRWGRRDNRTEDEKKRLNEIYNKSKKELMEQLAEDEYALSYVPPLPSGYPGGPGYHNTLANWNRMQKEEDETKHK